MTEDRRIIIKELMKEKQGIVSNDCVARDRLGWITMKTGLYKLSVVSRPAMTSMARLGEAAPDVCFVFA
jgi:hypothetical protein